MPDKKERELKVLTRKEGVRTENPLFKMYGDKYYPDVSLRTPELRNEADGLLPTPYVGSAVDKSVGEAAPLQTGSQSTHKDGNF